MIRSAKQRPSLSADVTSRAKRWSRWGLLLALTAGLLAACRLEVLEEKGARKPGYQPTANSHTIVFIHGMYLTPKSWGGWEKYFQNLGYTTLSPAWPEHESSVAEQNAAHPNPDLAALKLDDVVEHYRQIVVKLKEKPVVIGHSMGGLVAQKLLQEKLVAAAIAIDSAPPLGVVTVEPNFLRANAAVLDPAIPASQPVKMTLEQFGFAFTNGMTSAEQEEAYRTYIVPESRRVGRASISQASALKYKVARAPLLLIAGGEDNTVTATLNYTNYRRYADSPSITDFKQFPERNHWTIRAAGWESVAAYIQKWIVETKAPVVRSQPPAVVREDGV